MYTLTITITIVIVIVTVGPDKTKKKEEDVIVIPNPLCNHQRGPRVLKYITGDTKKRNTLKR